MTGGGSTGGRDESPRLGESGLSEFGARVLGQLALSAWLPAALLTSVGIVVVQFAAQGAIDLGLAIDDLMRDKWTVVLLAVPVLVMATLVTQAFSFESIRALEGYWHRRGLATWARRILISHQSRRKRSIRTERLRRSHEAFLDSRAAWLDRGFSAPLVNALERASRDEDPLDTTECINETDLAKLQHLNWRTRCSPVEMAEIYYLSKAEEEYPAEHRLLPTRLGNIMRATEDRLTGASDDVEGYALRRREHASPRVQLQHDQFRTRLDMYCTLFFVSLLLALFTLVVLGVWVAYPSGWALTDVAWTIGLAAALGALAWASYLASIASARGYLTALVHMDEAPTGGSH